MGQYIQDGLRNLFETVIHVGKAKKSITIKEDKDNVDGLNFLAGKEMAFVNNKAFEGTLLAHTDGGVPNLIINVPELSEYYFGSNGDKNVYVYIHSSSCYMFLMNILILVTIYFTQRFYWLTTVRQKYI